MKELSSSEFRRVFARLTEPVTVTVLGRPIATYTPLVEVRAHSGGVHEDGTTNHPPINFSTTPPPLTKVVPFRPAPKSTRKQR